MSKTIIAIINDEEFSAIDNKINQLEAQNYIRNHESFLSDYAPEDEGLYDY